MRNLFLLGERDRLGRTVRRLAEPNNSTSLQRVFGGTPNTAGETPALPETNRTPPRQGQFMKQQIWNSGNQERQPELGS